jgi:multisubunit Na+/H+ antiporter MnhG subunit
VNLVLIWSGVVVVAVAALRLLFAGEVFLRLHFAGAVTSLATPLIIVGLMLTRGVWSSAHDVLKLLVIGVLLFGTGPAVVIATARAAAQVSHRARSDDG